MIWHPLFLTTLIVQITGLLLLVSASMKAFGVVIDWRPAFASQKQLRLEAKAETAVYQMRWALGLYIFSIFLLIVGVTNLYPEMIPGAMCGTGVLQAMNESGGGFLILNILLIAVLLYWNALETLNRKQTDYPLAVFNARLILLSLPVSILAFGQTLNAAVKVDIHRPVDCCAVIYNQFRNISEAHQISGLPDQFWIVTWITLSVLLFWVAIRSRDEKSGNALTWKGLLAVTSAAWVPVAVIILVNILSAYHYGVLQHHCPWCLFLFQHKAVGFPLFAVLLVITFEAIAAFLLPVTIRATPTLIADAFDRGRTAANRVIWGLLVFILVSVLPAIIWRLRFGVWISG
jgi:hypothetical protein